MHRGDVIRTRGLYVPNVALYQTEPHPDIHTTIKIIQYFIDICQYFNEKNMIVFEKIYRYTNKVSKISLEK